MPKCKNDETRSYTGNEPSPKGRGYCAHAEEVGKRRKGKDGKFWVVRETKKVKRWFKMSKSVRSPRGVRTLSDLSARKIVFNSTSRKVSEMLKDPRIPNPVKQEIKRAHDESSFDNETLRKAVNEYTTNPNMAIRKYGPIENWKTSQVTDMSGLFRGKKIFNTDISAWDVSRVTNMRSMFEGAREFNKPIGNWDVGKVEDMSFMFFNAFSFNQPINTRAVVYPNGIRYLAWDVSNVKDMNNMFNHAISFNKPIDRWNVSNVRDMSKMFRGARVFNQPIDRWNVKKVENMKEIFLGSRLIPWPRWFRA